MGKEFNKNGNKINYKPGEIKTVKSVIVIFEK